jgi:putative DNA primase/helicase
MPHNSDISAMQEQISAAKEAEEQLFAPDENAADEITSGFIRSCLYNNERGDGLLFARLQRGRFVQVKNWGKCGVWLHWVGHHWEIDKKDAARNAVEEVAQLYLKEAMDLKTLADNETDKKKAVSLDSDRKLYLKRVNKLRSVGGAKNCLEWATTLGDQSLAIIGDDIDTHPWLLACQNGVIDLRSGKFSPGRPTDYLLWTVPVPWIGINHPCPEWDRFFDEIHMGDAVIKHFVHKYFGYLITGSVVHHVVGVFSGEGRNGKGTEFDLLRDLLGDLAWTITPEMLMERKHGTTASGAASADLMSLRGRRAIFAEESDDNQKISESAYKKLSGGGNIKARAPHDRDETNFKPTHKIVFYTNSLPRGLASSFAMKKRLVMVNYPLKFVTDPDPSDPFQRPGDPDLPEKLRREMSGILAWLVRGCLMMQEEGLSIPDSMRAVIDEQERKDDTILSFFNDMLEAIPDPEDVSRHDQRIRVAFKDIYGAFEVWHGDTIGGNERWRPTKKAVSSWLDKRGFRRSKPSGIAHFHGLRIKIEGDLS